MAVSAVRVFCNALQIFLEPGSVHERHRQISSWITNSLIENGCGL